MSRFKKAFSSRHGHNGVIVEVDWSQLEICVLQIESEDQELKRELLNNVDLHSKMTAEIHKMDYEYVVERVRAHDPVWQERRRDTKRARFALQYGAYAKRISLLTGWDLSFAENFIDTYYLKYSGISRWQKEVEAEVNKTAKPFGVNGELKGQYTSPSGRRYVFTTSPNWQGEQRFSPTQLKNYPIQGLAADFVGHMAGKLLDRLLQSGLLFHGVHMINEIHDSLIFDVIKNKEDDLYDAINKVYGNAAQEMSAVVQGKRPVEIPLKYEYSAGSTWNK